MNDEQIQGVGEVTYDHDTFCEEVKEILDGIFEMLAGRNLAYGNSALDPVRIFSKASADEQLRVRIDDKLSRLARGSDAGEDVVHDLLGYLVLLRIAQRRSPLSQEEQGVVIEQSSTSYVPYVGPFVGKRVVLVLDEKVGVVTVDDDDKIEVQLDVSGALVEYPLEIFKNGLKQKWIAWEEEQKNGDEEKAE